MKRRSNNQLPNNLPQLQNCIKKDPTSYQEEFEQQHHHYQSMRDIFHFNPTSNDKNFEALIMFLAQIAQCYPDQLKDYPNQLIETLQLYSTVLHPDIRFALCKSLILLRNKNLLAPNDLLNLFFELLKCPDKNLRSFLKIHMVTDIKNVNQKHKNAKLNSVLQNFMYAKLNEGNAIASKAALDILTELYFKNVWKDVKTVNVIASACFSKITKILVAALKFFLGKDEEGGNDGSSDSDSDNDTAKTVQEVAMANRFNKSSRKRKRMLEKTKQVVKKAKKKSKPVGDFTALHLLHDPQDMTEKLLRSLEKMNERFEVKLMVMNLISRLIGVHKLFIFNFYPLLQRFLRPHQREVTSILLYTAQAAHELVPPETLEPLLKTIANNFVTERNSSECMAVGLNTIRELCLRCPLVMSDDLLQDLAQYKSYKDKNVSMAAKSVIQLFRTVNPEMLKRKDRGRPTEASADLKAKQYGELEAKNYIPGTEVLSLEEENDQSLDHEEISIESDDLVLDDTEQIDNLENDNDETDDEEEIDEDDEEEIDQDQNESDIDDEEEDDTANQTKQDSKNLELSLEEKKEKAAIISSTRILSQDEFRRVRNAELSKHIRASQPRRFNKNANADEQEEFDDEDLEEFNEKNELVKLNAIERLYKRRRLNKEAKADLVNEGRKGREFAGGKTKMNPNSSKNNKEKKKNKTFMMIKHKADFKKKRSFHEKQLSLKHSLLKKLRQ